MPRAGAREGRERGQHPTASAATAGVWASVGTRGSDPVSRPGRLWASRPRPRRPAGPGRHDLREEGRFDNLPQYPRSEPLGPRHEKEGVVTRSFKVQGASPDQIMSFYRDALQERWTMITGIEKLGVGTLRADWVNDEYRVRVSATREGELDERDDVAKSVVAQYSLTLNPLPVGNP